MSTKKRRRRWRFIEDEFAPGGRRRVLEVMHRGFPGFVVRWTDACSGCFEQGESGGRVYCGGYDAAGNPVGAGCEECGYTGKRRCEYWIPFDWPAWERHAARLERRRLRRLATPEPARD